MNDQLEGRVHQLTEANAELEAFNYTISHDLRSPLRSMQGFAQALIEDCNEQLDDTGKGYTRRIMTSSQYMDTLLQDLLKYSRLSRTEMDRTTLNLDAVINEVVESLNREIEEKKATLEVHRPLAAVYANLSTLKQVLANLISNALKFTEPDRAPRIRIHTERHGGAVRIRVEDNGIGIAQEHQDKIFGLFERLHNVTRYPRHRRGARHRPQSDRTHGRQSGIDLQAGTGKPLLARIADASARDGRGRKRNRSCARLLRPKRKVRATDAKEVGVRNPAEENVPPPGPNPTRVSLGERPSLTIGRTRIFL